MLTPPLIALRALIGLSMLGLLPPLWGKRRDLVGPVALIAIAAMMDFWAGILLLGRVDMVDSALFFMGVAWFTIAIFRWHRRHGSSRLTTGQEQP